MNRDEYIEKWTPFAANIKTAFAAELDALIESVRLDEEDNAARLCQSRAYYENYKGNLGRAITARELAADIRTGERAAPADSVEAAEGDGRKQMICRIRELEGGLYRAVKIIGKLYRTFSKDKSTDINWHKIVFQRNRLFDLSVGAIPLNTKSPEADEANRRGFYGPPDYTPEPPEAPVEEPWRKTSEELPPVEVGVEIVHSGCGIRQPEARIYKLSGQEGAGWYKLDRTYRMAQGRNFYPMWRYPTPSVPDPVEAVERLQEAVKLRTATIEELRGKLEQASAK